MKYDSRGRAASSATATTAAASTAATSRSSATVSGRSTARRSAATGCCTTTTTSAATAATAPARTEEAGRNPVREFASEADGVVVSHVGSPIDIEVNAVVRPDRLELRLLAVDGAFVDRQLRTAFEDRACEFAAVHFEVQTRFSSAATSTAASTTAGRAVSLCSRRIGDPLPCELRLRIR